MKTNLVKNILLYSIIVITLFFSSRERVSAQAGPAQPEALQFEPVDVTDIVNLATGDFVYTLPIMDVPSPEGGYPFAISYHSGIGLNQEATWVGLGWSLNPGSISRIVNGYPDDYKGENVNTNFSGSSSSGMTIGLAVGYGPIGIGISWDSHTGMGGPFAMIKYGFDLWNTGIGVNGVMTTTGSFDVGVGYRNFEAGASFGNHSPSFNAMYNPGALSLGIGLSGGEATYAASLRIGPLGSLGVSFGSEGLKGNHHFAGVGLSSMSKSTNGKFSSSSFMSFVPIPPYAWIMLSFSGWEWHLREGYDNDGYGYLHQSDYFASGAPTSKKKYERHIQGNHLYTSQDIYQANAQGVNGLFMPFVKDQFVLVDHEENDQKAWLTSAAPQHNPYFRFLDDKGSNFVTDNSTPSDYQNIFSNRFASKKVEALPFDANGKIPGFVITTTDGKIYEYLQPVNAIQYSSSSGMVGSTSLSSQLRFDGWYATNWYLTTIKGPDYVDRDPIGVVEKNDWGYWVKFSYVKENLPHAWRSPHSGTAPGSSTDHFETYSIGMRDMVYLESIETPTHVAMFRKSDVLDKQMTPDGLPWNLGLSRWVPGISDDAYYIKGDHTAHITRTIGDPVIMTTTVHYMAQTECSGSSSPPSVSCELLLENGINEGKTILKSQITSLTYEPATDETKIVAPRNYSSTVSNYSCECYVPNADPPGWYPTPVTGYNPTVTGGIFRVADFQVENRISNAKKLDKIELYQASDTSHPIKTVKFDYDYTLCPGTPNSAATPSDGADKGKLKLRSIQFLGQNNVVGILPSYQFEYANGNTAGTGRNPSHYIYDWDDWGSYRDPGNPTDHGKYKHQTPQDLTRANMAAAWSLTKITTPLAGTLNIEYESDSYHYVADTYDFSKTDIYDGNYINSFQNKQGFDFGTDPVPQITLGNNANEWTLMDPQSEVDNPGAGSTIFFFSKIRNTGQGAQYILDKRIANSWNNNIITLDEPYLFQRGSAETVYYLFVYGNHKLGGGIRVKSITSSDGTNSYKTTYDYTTIDDRSSQISSGVTASIPWTYGKKFDLSGRVQESINIPDFPELKKFLSTFLDDELSYGRPAPGIIYSKVTVRNVDPGDGHALNGKTVYDFFTAKDFPPEANDDNTSSTFASTDRSGIYGTPKSTAYYENSAEGVERKVKEELWAYKFSSDLHDAGDARTKDGQAIDLTTKPLGIIQERYSFDNQNVLARSNVSKTYENIYQSSQSQYEYSYSTPTSTNPEGDISTETKNFRWDALSGEMLASATKDSKGVVEVTKTTPAYWTYSASNGQMEGKNMLSQVFQQTLFRSATVDFTGVKNYSFPATDVASSTVTTWSDQWTYQGETPSEATDDWRVNETYIYDRNYPYVEFLPDSQSRTTDLYPPVSSAFPWFMTSNVTKYDRYSRSVQNVTRDGIYSSSIYSYDNSLVTAIASNAKRGECGYISFESGWESWNQASNISETYSHTGKKSAMCIGSAGMTKNFYCSDGVDKTKPYILEAWVDFFGGTPIIKIEGRDVLDNPVAGISKSVTITSGTTWKYVSVIINPQEMTTLPSDGSLKVSCGFPGGSNEVYIDDIRFRPRDAAMTTYTYDPLTWKLTSITDQNNLTTYYEYDNEGRLVLVRDRDRNVRQKYIYHYARTN